MRGFSVRVLQQYRTGLSASSSARLEIETGGLVAFHLTACSTYPKMKSSSSYLVLEDSLSSPRCRSLLMMSVNTAEGEAGKRATT